MSTAHDGIDLGVLTSLDRTFASPTETNAMLEEFVQAATDWVAGIARESRTGTGTEGHRSAHALASSAAMVGAHAIAQRALTIERALACGELPDASLREGLAGMLVELRAAWRDAGRLGPPGGGAS